MQKRAGKATVKTMGYDPTEAERFWTKRLTSVDPLAAVLTYDASAEANEAYDFWEKASLIRLLDKPIKNKTALDIGCGTGRIALTLAKKGAHVTAVDVSSAMLRFCYNEARKARVHSRIRCIQASAHRLPCSDRQFDIITCCGVLEHLPEIVRAGCIAEAARVLKPHGKMYVVVNNDDNPFLRQRYRVKKPMPKGYFVTLVGLGWVKKACGKRNLSVVLRAANPCYALVHYGMMSSRSMKSLSHRERKALFQSAAELDLQQPLLATVYQRLASHFLVEITHKRQG